MDFINLYVQTEYSILSSAISLDRLFSYAKDNNLSTLAICDNDLYGAYKFYKRCLKENIKPLIGMCLNLNYKDASSDASKAKDNLLLYAYNYEGYVNLCKLASIKQVDGFGEDKYAVLSKHSRGLIAIAPGMESAIVASYSRIGDNREFIDNVLFMNGIFDYFYIGMMLQTALDKELFSGLYVLCKANNIKIVALHKSSFIDNSEIETYKTIKLISLISAGAKEYECSERENNSFYLDSELASRLFSNYPDLIDQTGEIASICNLQMDNNGYHFPKYHLVDGSVVDAKSYLADLAKVGLNKRLANQKDKLNKADIYKNRLLYELDVISKMGFCDYFLIVYDYVRYAKMNNILVGPGRGSGAGSLVSYSLGITNTDPIEYDLLFERFLNPERVTMPDIDVDFPDDARDQIYAYLISRYGKEKVAHIGTFGTFKPRSAIRDVAKVLGIKDNTINIISDYIPQYNSPSLDSIANGVVDIKKMISSNQDIAKLFKLASQIENMPRNVSTHASGIVIGDIDLVSYTPLAKGLNGIYQTQYEASDIEDIGLVKMDILSLSNLNTISKIINDVKSKTGIAIDINKIDYNDQKVFSLMASGDTDGIFQFESAGMRKLLRDLKVSCLEDMIIANAIYRPGPQEMIPTFIKRKEGEKYKGIDSSIDDILASTYGIIIFQEQIMLIAQRYANFSLGQADLLRRAVSKKKSDELAKMRNLFVSGAINNNHSLEDANKIYDYIVKFGDYGFNRSHAAVYSIVAYQMAYLKTHFYPFFMSSLMETSLADKDKMEKYIASLKKNRYNILPPDINVSSTTFEVVDKNLYYPLQGVKGISLGVAKEIINNRNNGSYYSYDDFVLRTKDILNKRMVNSLAASGAFDSLGITRKVAIEEYDNIIARSIYNKAIGDKLMLSTYGEDEYDLDKTCELEKEALGFNLKYDEFMQYNDYARRYHAIKLIDMKLGSNLVIAKVDYISEYNSKRGLMAFLKIRDSSLSQDITIFSSEYDRFRSMIFAGNVYLFEVVVNKKDDKLMYHLTNLRKL